VLESGPQRDEALLLIHGFPTSSWDWEAVWPTLTARYRVLAIVRAEPARVDRGHPGTPWPRRAA
jgi:pimeloyl-ACP methyl ester carboxylesterase